MMHWNTFLSYNVKPDPGCIISRIIAERTGVRVGGIGTVPESEICMTWAGI